MIYVNPNSDKAIRLYTKKVVYHEMFHNFNPGFGTLNSNKNDLMWWRSKGFVCANYLINKNRNFIDKYKQLISMLFSGHGMDNIQIGNFLDNKEFDKYVIDGKIIPLYDHHWVSN